MVFGQGVARNGFHHGISGTFAPGRHERAFGQTVAGIKRFGAEAVFSKRLRERGERQGETGFSLKTRLLGIESLAIDGVVVYRRADDPTAELRRTSRRRRAETPNGAPVSATSAVDALPETVRTGRAANARP